METLLNFFKLMEAPGTRVGGRGGGGGAAGKGDPYFTEVHYSSGR